MPFALPAISRADFGREIHSHSPEPLQETMIDALYSHYQELATWNRRLSLIGPGTAGEIVERHYGESLAALPLIPTATQVALDLGSGAGFPGLVLAASRLGLEMTLVEAQERKWAFLLAAARRASLPCRCLNARVSVPLPAGIPDAFDLVTARALKLEPSLLEALAGRLRPGGRMLLWAGERDPELPPNLAITEERRLTGSERRRIVVLQSIPSPEWAQDPEEPFS
jgi:16S rRNA (guanine(527)-N(7))-methyltransferase RsmG